MKKTNLLVVAFEHQIPRAVAAFIFHDFQSHEDEIWQKMLKYINEQDQRTICPLR